MEEIKTGIEKGELFNDAMVKAILRGDKRQTRRVVKTELSEYAKFVGFDKEGNIAKFCEMVGIGLFGIHYAGINMRLKYAPGDKMYVRETWAKAPIDNGEELQSEMKYEYVYRASPETYADYEGIKWKPNLHMPKEAARIWLRVTNVRVERVQDITEDDIKAEGVALDVGVMKDFVFGTLEKMGELPKGEALKQKWIRLWDSVSEDGRKWSDNPFVFVYEFEPMFPPYK
jgi:hypothetical protein